MIDKRIPFCTGRLEVIWTKKGKINARIFEYNYPYFIFYNSKGKVVKKVSKEILEYCKNWLIKNGPGMGHGYTSEEITKLMELSEIAS